MEEREGGHGGEGERGMEERERGIERGSSRFIVAVVERIM